MADGLAQIPFSQMTAARLGEGLMNPTVRAAPALFPAVGPTPAEVQPLRVTDPPVAAEPAIPALVRHSATVQITADRITIELSGTESIPRRAAAVCSALANATSQPCTELLRQGLAADVVNEVAQRFDRALIEPRRAAYQNEQEQKREARVAGGNKQRRVLPPHGSILTATAAIEELQALRAQVR